MTVEIVQGDAFEVLRTLPTDHFHCVVTSPPYWGLRDYGVDDQIGLEPTPEEWCARLVVVFREVRRVLRPDGVCFVNIGDSYCSGTEARQAPTTINGQKVPAGWSHRSSATRTPSGDNYKPKDLLGQPWMLAFALRTDGWWLRSEIIWAKPNPMPESVRDRPTKAHEQVFLLTKRERYFYDAEAVREPNLPQSEARVKYDRTGPRGWQTDAVPINGGEPELAPLNPAGRNLRSVWTIATEPLPSIIVDGEKLDHFASYPIELARRCILAGTSAKGCCPECGAPWARVVVREASVPQRDYYAGSDQGKDGRRYMRNGGFYPTAEPTGWRRTCSCEYVDGERFQPPPIPCRVLDPFGGSGRTALATEELGRDCTLIELNPASVRMAKAQIERAKARRFIGDAERVPVPEGQLGLFG